LKRKENALVLWHGTFVGPKIGWTDLNYVIENRMLDRRFSVAPLMDWTDCAEKAKWHQRLGMVAIGHAVPNAVPMLLISFTSE
jgi:hypothetical protein